MTPAGIVCLLSPFCVCLPTQPGVSNPGSGPHGRRDAADWSQRVFSALPGVRLHHHTARRHVRETLCAHMHQAVQHAGTHSDLSAFINTDLHVQINTSALSLVSSARRFNLCLCNDLFVPWTAVPGPVWQKFRESCPTVGESSWQLSKQRSKQIETAAHCALEQFLMQMSQWWRPF